MLPRICLNIILTVLLITLASCSSSHRDIGPYVFRDSPIDSNVLTIGWNQIFVIEIFANEDITVDAFVVDILATPTVDVVAVEVRDETTRTLPNSKNQFGPSNYPLRLHIPILQFIPGGTKKIFVIYLDVRSFTTSNNLQMGIADIQGIRSDGRSFPPFGDVRLGPRRESGA